MKLNHEDKLWIGVFDGPANTEYTLSGYKLFTKCTQKIILIYARKEFLSSKSFFNRIDADFVFGYHNKSSINTLWCLSIFL